MNITPQTPMKIMSLGLMVTIATASLHAQETGLRTDWSGRGKDSSMRDASNWTKGLPTPETVCIAKKGSLQLGPNSGSEAAFTCAALLFQEDEAGDPAPKSLEISGDLAMKDTASRWPNNGSLQVRQTGGNITSDSDLLFAVKPGSSLDYELQAGSLTLGKLLTGEGKTLFKQTGGHVEADEIFFGKEALGNAEYTISGGSLMVQKLVLGKDEGAGTFTVSGTQPVVFSKSLQLLPKGALVFVSDGSGVATVGSQNEPISKAELNGTVSLKYSGTAPESGKVVNLIYAKNINAVGLVLDPETAAKWEIVNSKIQKCSVFGLKAK